MDNQNLTLEILKEPMAIGEVFAASGMFPDIKTQAQAVVKIMAGKELGLSPLQSVCGIYMVNGRLALQANVMASLIRRSEKYEYTVDSLTAEECTISFYDISDEESSPLGVSNFTIKDAAKAGLVNKDNWKNHPKNMLFARALSNGVRWYCPDAICGWYSVEEMNDIQEPPIEASKIIELTKEGEVKDATTQI